MASVADEVEETEGQEQEAEVQETEEQPEPSEIDNLAAELGWRPKSEWAGEESDWVDSREFLRKTNDMSRTRGREIKDLKKQIDGISKAQNWVVEQARQAERDRLEALYDRAVEDGDTAESRKVRARIESLAQPVQPDLPPEGQDFAQRHASWFHKDQEATEYAINRSNHYAKQGLSPARQLAAVERDMKENFPELFPQQTAPKPQPAMGRPSRQVSQPREKGYGTLPPEARKICDQFVREQAEQGNGWATKEAWSKAYYEQQGA